MKKVPFPKFDDLDDDEADAAEDAFHEKVSQADWRASPKSVLATVDKLLKEHGLEVRIYKAEADSVFFDIVAK
jgi:hypothetical protein